MNEFKLIVLGKELEQILNRQSALNHRNMLFAIYNILFFSIINDSNLKKI